MVIDVWVDDVGVTGGDGKRDERCSNDSKQQLNFGIPTTVVGGIRWFHAPPRSGAVGVVSIEALLWDGDFEHRFETIFVIQVWTQSPHDDGLV